MLQGKLNYFVSSYRVQLVVAVMESKVRCYQTSRLWVQPLYNLTLKKACVSATNREGQDRADPAAAAVAAFDLCD